MCEVLGGVTGGLTACFVVGCCIGGGFALHLVLFRFEWWLAGCCGCGV